MNNFREFEKIAIRRIALSIFRTTGPWPVNCIKIGGHVALLSCPSIYFLFYDQKPAIVPLEHEIYRRITAFIAVFDAAGDSIRKTYAWLHAIKKGGNGLCFRIVYIIFLV